MKFIALYFDKKKINSCTLFSNNQTILDKEEVLLNYLNDIFVKPNGFTEATTTTTYNSNSSLSQSTQVLHKHFGIKPTQKFLSLVIVT